jgi:hypothetical protein
MGELLGAVSYLITVWYQLTGRTQAMRLVRVPLCVKQRYVACLDVVSHRPTYGPLQYLP